MNWQVFTELSSLQVQIHWLAAIVTLVLGLVIMVLRKGTASHKAAGRVYLLTMVVTAVSAFFIRSYAPGEQWSLWSGFSVIHLLIPYTLIMLWLAIVAIRQGRVRAHRAGMIWTFVGGMLVAGAFTFLPGRHMHSLLFADSAFVQGEVDRGYKK